MGETIADEAKWTEEQLASLTFSGAMNWSRSAAKEYFESLMSDSSNAAIIPLQDIAVPLVN